jgi:hypothetical protein
MLENQFQDPGIRLRKTVTDWTEQSQLQEATSAQNVDSKQVHTSLPSTKWKRSRAVVEWTNVKNQVTASLFGSLLCWTNRWGFVVEWDAVGRLRMMNREERGRSWPFFMLRRDTCLKTLRKITTEFNCFPRFQPTTSRISQVLAWSLCESSRLETR